MDSIPVALHAWPHRESALRLRLADWIATAGQEIQILFVEHQPKAKQCWQFLVVSGPCPEIVRRGFWQA